MIITIYNNHRTFSKIEVLTLCFQILCLDIFKTFYCDFSYKFPFEILYIKIQMHF